MARVCSVACILFLRGTAAQSLTDFSGRLRGSESGKAVFNSFADESFKFSTCFAEGSGFDKPPSLNASDFESLLLPAPSLNGTKEDLAILRFTQESRSPETVMQQYAFLSNKNIFAFDAAMGANLEKDAPTFAKCMAAFYDSSVGDVKDHFKDLIKRDRPFVHHSDIKPCLPLESSFSYPSGHATFYALISELLSGFKPELKERLQEVGKAGVYARVIGGVHYPSDVEGGRKLGRAAAKSIMETPLWKALLSKPSDIVKKELETIQEHQPYAGLPIQTR
jgi:acid phosphatase (class A)